MFDTKVFGTRLLSLREARKLSQLAVAKVLGFTRTQLSDIENGKTGTTLSRLVRLAEFYHVSTDYLLGITDDPAWRGTPRSEDPRESGQPGGQSGKP